MAVLRRQTARVAVEVRGDVQGVGFRPFVYRLAVELGLTGWVSNDGRGVSVEVEGPRAELDVFLERLAGRKPLRAAVHEIAAAWREPFGYERFEIRAGDQPEGRAALVMPDIATCPECLREVFDPADRRHGYAFTSCTDCGPRVTILATVPYDRPNTTMAQFTMCEVCAAEYADPRDRRFHAQASACPDCGPRLSLEDSGGAPVARDDASPVAVAARLLAAGRIVAIKGLGGFHLACDATNEAPVQRLREQKRRLDKPFALMAADVAMARRFCRVDQAESVLLESPARPIVLLERRASGVGAVHRHTQSHEDAAGRAGGAIASGVAPGNRELGVMLPYTPLHHLLLREFRRCQTGRGPVVLVMTSGNLGDEPLAIDNGEARRRLAGMADYFLAHDRAIEVRCDDSVARVFEGRELLIRRSRGYAPRPLRLSFDLGDVLATGAELKNTFCLTKGCYAFLSQHVGDLANLDTLLSYEAAIAHHERLFDIAPQLIAHDLHPDYMTTHYAKEEAIRRWGVDDGRLIAVQHHHAHIASAMAEQGLDGEVIGVAFDGSGCGTDGAVWGGEFLIAGYRRFRRAAHLAYVPLPGLDQAVRQPFRMAISHLWAAFGESAGALPLDLWGRLDPRELAVVRRQITAGLNSPPTSSCGRLFDAVASLLGIRDVASYEGQAALELQMLADPQERARYPLACHLDGRWPAAIEVAPLIRSLVDEILRGVQRPVIAARFHNTLAEIIAEVCCRLRGETGLSTVVLSGGVFQNTLLLKRTIALLREAGLIVAINRQVPCNDGGIALGQAAIAAHSRAGSPATYDPVGEPLPVVADDPVGEPFSVVADDPVGKPHPVVADVAVRHYGVGWGG